MVECGAFVYETRSCESRDRKATRYMGYIGREVLMRGFHLGRNHPSLPIHVSRGLYPLFSMVPSISVHSLAVRGSICRTLSASACLRRAMYMEGFAIPFDQEKLTCNTSCFPSQVCPLRNLGLAQDHTAQLVSEVLMGEVHKRGSG